MKKLKNPIISILVFMIFMHVFISITGIYINTENIFDLRNIGYFMVFTGFWIIGNIIYKKFIKSQ